MSTCFAVGTQRKEKSEMAEYMVIRLIMAGSIIGLLLLMDLLMIGTLLISFGLVWLLVKWCQKQVEEQE